MGKYCDEKRGRRRDERGREERAEEERNCTARVSYRVITILGHFHPLPPLFPRHRLPPSHPPIYPSRRPRRLLTLNFLSCITALRLSSRVKKKKYKWKKPAERTISPLPARKRSASSNLSISLVASVSSPSRPLVLVASFLFFFFFLQRTRKHDRSAIDPKTLYGETRQRNAEYRRKFTFVMACNKYLFDRTLFQLFI